MEVPLELLRYIGNNKINLFEKHLHHGVGLNLRPTFEEETLLDVICSEGKSEFLKILLKYKPELNEMNAYSKKYPIHFAVNSRDLNTIRVLLEQPNIKVNALAEGTYTPLLTALRYHQNRDKHASEINTTEKIVKLLLQRDADVNIPNSHGLQPITMAAEYCRESTVLLFLHSNQQLDLDTYKNWRNKSSREIITEKFPDLKHVLNVIPNSNKAVTIFKLFDDLSRKAEEEFVEDFKSFCQSVVDKDSIFRLDNGGHTLLQLAVDLGLTGCIQYLLDEGADPNFVFRGNSDPVAVIAYKNGHHEIFKTITRNRRCNLDGPNGDTLLHIVVKDFGRHTSDKHCNYKTCFNNIFEQNNDNFNINAIDSFKSTALHYAVRNGYDEAVTKLLENGSYIGVRNDFRKLPIDGISPKVFEEYLDTCVQGNNFGFDERNFEITFNYKFLKPCRIVIKKNPTRNVFNKEDPHHTSLPITDGESTSNEDLNYCCEMDPIVYMSQSKELEHLLKHPVISSFMYLKWYRLRRIFRVNLIFYTIFCVFLITYMLLGFSHSLEDDNVWMLCSYFISAVGLCVLIVREFFQLLISLKLYFSKFENYLEICLVSVSSAILFGNWTDRRTVDQLSAVAVLLAAATLMELIGQLSYFSTNRAMLSKVSRDFLQCFFTNSLYILAFALSFYILFRELPDDPTDVDDEPSVTTAEDDDTNFFDYPSLTLIKTFVMLTGELDTPSIKFSNYPILSHIIFILFVFLITIVLFNLLNGLAVSDTHAIKSDAELVGLKTRAELLAYYEGVLVGDVNFYKAVISTFRRLFGCGKTVQSKHVRLFAKTICLFPNYLPESKILVKINQNNDIMIAPEIVDNNEKSCFVKNCQRNRMEPKIVKSALKILNNDCSIEDADLEKKLNILEKTLRNEIHKLDTRKTMDIILEKIKKLENKLESDNKEEYVTHI